MKKNLIFSVVIAILSLYSVLAQSDSTSSERFIAPVHKSCIGHIVSYEHLNLSTDFQIEAKCYFLDTVNIDGLVWQLPTGWSMANLNSNYIDGNQGDSILLSFTLSIPDTANLPFYPQLIKLEMQINKHDSIYQSVILAGQVYFTPYNSIEIWNLEDFYDLKRNWLQEDSIVPPRIYCP